MKKPKMWYNKMKNPLQRVIAIIIIIIIIMPVHLKHFGGCYGDG
jgi:hypothetical protein